MMPSKFVGEEGHALDLAHRLYVDQEPAAQQQGQLAEVHLRQHDLRVARQHLAEVGRERIEVPQLSVGDLDAVAAGTPARLTNGAVGRAPAQQQQFGVAGGVVHLEIRYLDAGDLLWRSRTIRSWLAGS